MIPNKSFVFECQQRRVKIFSLIDLELNQKNPLDLTLVLRYKFQNISPFYSAGEQISLDISSRPFNELISRNFCIINK